MTDVIDDGGTMIITLAMAIARRWPGCFDGRRRGLNRVTGGWDNLHRAGRSATLAPVGSPNTVRALFLPCVLLGLATCLPEFDPDLESGASASTELDSCGSQGRPCCVAPNQPCQGALLCSQDQLCVRQPVLLCDDDTECRDGEVCCPAGLVGTCEAVAREACPVLDLAATSAVLDTDPIEVRVFDPEVEGDRCLIDRGCVGGPGRRRLLRFSTTVANVGEADLLLGSPMDSVAPTINTCAGEPRFAAFVRYELVDSTGAVARQDVPAACTPGTSQLALPFDCDFQGLWRDFSQLYGPTSIFDAGQDDCRWLDITDVLPGDYTLRVTVNPDATLRESNLGNNTPLELPLTVPAFGPATAPCPELPNPLLGDGANRECGWARTGAAPDAPAVQCSPGEFLSLTCSSSDPAIFCSDYRVCDGADICSFQAAVESGLACFTSGSANLFPSCPLTGQYSVWVPGDDQQGVECTPDFFPIEPPVELPDAGAQAEP